MRKNSILKRTTGFSGARTALSVDTIEALEFGVQLFDRSFAFVDFQLELIGGFHLESGKLIVELCRVVAQLCVVGPPLGRLGSKLRGVGPQLRGFIGQPRDVARELRGLV